MISNVVISYNEEFSNIHGVMTVILVKSKDKILSPLISLYSLYLFAPSSGGYSVISDHHKPSMLRARKSSIPISHSSSVRSRSSCDGSSIGSSSSQRPLTVTYKNITTSGMLFSKKTTSVDCGVYVKDPG